MGSLRQCLRQLIGVQAVTQSGLRALGNHSTKVGLRRGWKEKVSVNLDEAMRELLPNDPRWDYGVEISSGKRVRVEWIELHPAHSGAVGEVIRKARWLKARLSGASACERPSLETMHWLATDGVHIDAQRMRQLKAEGMRMPVKFVQLPTEGLNP